MWDHGSTDSRYQNQHKYLQTLGKLFKTKNADWKYTEKKSVKLKQANVADSQSFFLHFDMFQQTQYIYVPEALNPVNTHVK